MTAGLPAVSSQQYEFGTGEIKTKSIEVSHGGGLGQQKSGTLSRWGSRAALEASGALGFLPHTPKGLKSD